MMGKQKQKLNKNISDKVRKSKAAPEIQKNPFEVKINRKKFDVLGRKTKHDVGLPGVSRSKAINKRKETLLKEFRQKDKNNQFIDRRFGEYDNKLTPEEKILQRFTLERQRTQDRKDLYNLNEEEELTHYGQSLAEMEKMTDVIDSDSDSEEKGLLSAELTAAHFGGGGGLLRKKNAGDEDDKPRSRQELIEELIIKSKQEKRERQTQKEEAQVLTEKLDQEWKSIQNLMAHKTPKAERKELPEKPKLDEYDVMVRELGFEMKAQPSEKLKSAEELAREERQRLHALEVDRLRRMMGDTEEESAHTDKHISADDINDGFILDSDDRKTLAYKDGKWNLEDEEKDEDADDDDEDDEDERSREEAEEGEGDEEDEGEDDEDEGEDDEDGGEDDEDGHSDLQSDEGSEDDEDQVCDEEEADVKVTPAVNEEKMKSASKPELPYTFTAPESYEDLKNLLQDHSSDEQRLIVERTVKCTHPSLSAGNKAKLQKLFGFLMEYVGELATQNPPELKTINTLIPQIYSLCQMFPDAACKVMQTLLSDSAHSMEEMLEVKGRAAMPDLDLVWCCSLAAHKHNSFINLTPYL